MDYKRSKLKEWSIVSYLPEDIIQDIITTLYKTGKLLHYMYILHHSDNAVPHIHLALIFSEKIQYANLYMKFCGYLDENKNAINSFLEPAFHVECLPDYFLHCDEKSIKEGKFRYPDEELHSDNVDYFRDYIPTIKEDSVSSAMNDLMSGVSLIECVNRYGRDFVIYYSKYKDLLADIGYVYDYASKKFYERSAYEDRNSKDS